MNSVDPSPVASLGQTRRGLNALSVLGFATPTTYQPAPKCCDRLPRLRETSKWVNLSGGGGRSHVPEHSGCADRLNPLLRCRRRQHPLAPPDGSETVEHEAATHRDRACHDQGLSERAFWRLRRPLKAGLCRRTSELTAGSGRHRPRIASP